MHTQCPYFFRFEWGGNIKHIPSLTYLLDGKNSAKMGDFGTTPPPKIILYHVVSIPICYEQLSAHLDLYHILPPPTLFSDSGVRSFLPNCGRK